ncbi:MAG TPA: Zn-ribbon domain-containing OB-fold protein [Alphaproteobacteria bacterium]|nr:Zn-ribbon domain-containing OB-fold protein [Alphaproteobacteria bacterium]
MATEYAKPLPIPAPESEPFWNAAREHRLKIQKCVSCGHHRFPPAAHCPECLSADHEWVEASGKGRVFSFVTFQRLYNKGWEGEIPYVVALIELDEGPRLLSNVTGIAPEDVKCDMPVRVVFDDVTDDVTLPKFAPV